MNDPINALMRAAGYEFVQPTEEYRARNHTDLVFNALRKLGVSEERLPLLADKVAMAGVASGPRDVVKENRISAEDIEGAIRDIEAGLRLLNKGLHTIGHARSTATPNSADRIENLAMIQAALIGAIADAVSSGIGAGNSLDEKIADSVPDYWRDGFRDQWGVFSCKPPIRCRRLVRHSPELPITPKRRTEARGSAGLFRNWAGSLKMQRGSRQPSLIRVKRPRRAGEAHFLNL